VLRRVAPGLKRSELRAGLEGNLGVAHPWPIFNHPKGRDFVDFDEDLQVKDLKGPPPTAMTISSC
jgi:sarcosine oxidase subunit alpha